MRSLRNILAVLWGLTFPAGQALAQVVEVGIADYKYRPAELKVKVGTVVKWTSSNEGRYFVLKGGSFFEDRDYAMTTSRLLSIPNDSKDYVGFRCVKDVK